MTFSHSPSNKDNSINSDSMEVINNHETNMKQSNPLLEMAGIFEDDPLFDEFVENMAAYRRELDKEMAAEDEALEERFTKFSI